MRLRGIRGQATPSFTTEVTGALTPPQRVAVRTLIDRATGQDGVDPLNESAHLAVEGSTRTDGYAHQLVQDGTHLVGYQFLDSTGGDPTGQLVVDPAFRRRGIATAMLAEMGSSVRLWSFGDLAAARGFTTARDYVPIRELLVMSRELDPLPELELPSHTIIRPFADADLDQLLSVNSRAFAHHPEQGTMNADDVHTRMAEPWFDRAGFLVAERNGRVVGFHWTKRHDETTGEVYIIAVDPDHSGGGLGRQLLSAGLHHLRDGGATQVILYVEGDQQYVVDLYLSARFVVANRDVMYAPAAKPTSDEEAGPNREATPRE